MTSSALSPLSLPPELILEIADYLPPDGILALKFTHPILNYSLPLASRLQNRTLTRCARLAVRSYLAKPTRTPTHLRCILCKSVYPVKSFQSSSSPACAPLSFAAEVEDIEVVELPQRLCAWHVGRLVRVVRTELGGRNEWVDSSEQMCMHCGAIQSWAKCDCKCDSCSFRAVTAYTRHLNNKTECRKFLFYRKTVPDNNASTAPDIVKTQLFVRETCFGPGTFLGKAETCSILQTNEVADAADQSPVVHMPVRQTPAVISPTNEDAQICTVASCPTSVTSDVFLPPTRPYPQITMGSVEDHQT